MKQHLLSLILILLPLVASAHDIEVKNADGVTIYYRYINNGTELAVSYRGSYYSSYTDEYTGIVVIPEEVTYMNSTFKVTSIGYRAFYDCSGLTSVTIPSSVTRIEERAFVYCSGLTSVTIPSSVTSIGEGAFVYCSGLTSVIIPSSVYYIANFAFSGCTGLTSVTIPSSVTSIGNYVFSGCSGLNSLSVEEGNYCYDSRGNCNAIIKTGSNTLIIGCKNTIIPSSVSSIGESAFSGCTDLTSIIIPSSVSSIGDQAFISCTGLTSVTIPEGVTNIGKSAFSGCSGLTSVTIPSSVTDLSSHAFADCSSLTNVTISNGVTSIGDYAFQNCTNLTSLTIPSSVTSIGNQLFYGCIGLTSITIAEGNSIFDSRDNCNAIIETTSNTLIAGCKNTIILSSVTSIGDNAFYLCTGLTSVTIPSSVSRIGEMAFLFCTDLTSVTISEGVTNIEQSAFNGCSGLTTVTIPSSVSIIGDWAFSGCSGLTSVTISDGITSIGSGAFNDCSELTSVTVDISTPLTITSYVFSNRANAALYVPAGSKAAYEAADYWKEFKEIVELPINATDITLDLFTLSFTAAEQTAALTATVTPENTTNKSVTWTSSDTNVATVDENGVVTAVANGTATITATTADGTNLSATCEVTVDIPDVIIPEPNRLEADDIECSRSGIGTLSIDLINEAEIKLFQFDLHLPSGISVALNNQGRPIASLTGRADDHSISSSLLENGAYRFAISSPNNYLFTGNEGKIMNVTLQVEDAVVAGEYELTVSNIELTTKDNQAVRPNAFTVKVSVVEAKAGDVNGDGVVTVTDVGIAIDMVLELSPNGAIFAAADMNGDGIITVTDVGAIIDLVLTEGRSNVMMNPGKVLKLDPQ